MTETKTADEIAFAAREKSAIDGMVAFATMNAPAIGLTFRQLREQNMTRCARWHPGGIGEWSLSDWAVATGGELGEAMNIVKKMNRERDGIAGNTMDLVELQSELADELSDVAIYLDIWAASEGIDLGEAIAVKFNKTSEKVGFPERLPIFGADRTGVGALFDESGKVEARQPAGRSKDDLIEELLSMAWTEEWTDDHEELLGEWRRSRGEAAMAPWHWWVGEADADTFAEDCDTREAALELGIKEYSESGSFKISEVREWADNVKDGDDVIWFAESRNAQTIKAGDNDDEAKAAE